MSGAIGISRAGLGDLFSSFLVREAWWRFEESSERLAQDLNDQSIRRGRMSSFQSWLSAEKSAGMKQDWDQVELGN